MPTEGDYCMPADKTNPRPFIPGAPTPLPRSTPTGWPAITGRATIFSLATGFFSTTNPPAVAKRLSPGKSPALSPASNRAKKNSFTSEILTLSATGASPPNTSKRCGGSSSRTPRTTMSSEPGNHILSRNSSPNLSPMPAWIGRNTSRSIRDTTGRRKWNISIRTPPRPGRGWVGNRVFHFRNLSG